jgi:hypothetical protein
MSFGQKPFGQQAFSQHSIGKGLPSKQSTNTHLNEFFNVGNGRKFENRKSGECKILLERT